MLTCYICAGSKPLFDYFCQSCSRIRRYILNFGSDNVLCNIEDCYIKKEKLVKDEKAEEEMNKNKQITKYKLKVD